MRRHIAAVLVLAMSGLSVSVMAADDEKKPQSVLPARGLPAKTEMVFRITLERITKKNITASLDAVAKAVPEKLTEVHKGLKDTRTKVLPKMLEAKEQLRKHGVRELLVLGRSSSYLSDQNGDDPNASTYAALLRVKKDTEPAAVKKALTQAILSTYDAAQQLTATRTYTNADTLKALGLPADANLPLPQEDTIRDILKKDLGDLRPSRWADEWILLTKKDEKPGEPDTSGLPALNAAFARAGNAPITVAIRVTEETRAEALDTKDGEMFSAFTKSSARMRWAAGWAKLGAKPQAQLVATFDKEQDAKVFGAGATQLIMLVATFATLSSQGQGDVQGLLPDLMPTLSGKEVHFSITHTTLAKLLAVTQPPKMPTHATTQPFTESRK